MEEEYSEEYDAFEALCDAIFPSDEDGLMFYWKSHMDASGKHSDLLVVAGYLSQRPNWKAFNQAWRPLLTTNGQFAPFHAADFESGNGDFTAEKGWPKERREKTRSQLIDAVLGANLHLAVACCVKIDEYEQTIPKWKRGLLGLGTAYEFAVSACMSAMAHWCQFNNQPDPIQHIVELGEGREGKIQDAFMNVFRHLASQKFFRLGGLDFQGKDGALGLQAADMLANYLWNEKTGNRPAIAPYTQITQASNLRSDYFDKERIEREMAADKVGRTVITPEASLGLKIPDLIDIDVKADFSKVEKIVEELEGLSELNPEGVYSLIKHSSSFEKFFTVQAENVSASDANELRISLKPSDGALNAVATLRASNADSDLSKGRVGHDT